MTHPIDDGALRRKSRNRPVTRREYKLLLAAAPLRADEGHAELRALLWSAIGRAGVSPGAVDAQDDTRERTTWYLDTPDRAFRAHDLSLRIRAEDGDGEAHQVTLRARSTDRVLAATADLRTPLKGRRRFEEEILPWAGGAGSVFAQTARVSVPAPFAPLDVTGAAALFPMLERLAPRADRTLSVVRGFVARERTTHLCRLELADGFAARCWASAWSPVAGGPPVTLELAFDVDLATDDGGLERLPVAAALGARALFGALCDQLDERGWLDRRTRTRTDFAYERARAPRR